MTSYTYVVYMVRYQSNGDTKRRHVAKETTVV